MKDVLIITQAEKKSLHIKTEIFKLYCDNELVALKWTLNNPFLTKPTY